MSYDLSILGPPALSKSLLASDNTACTGVYKLLQRILILLFTEAAGIYNLGNGTTYPTDTESASADTEYIKNITDMAMASVKEILLANTAEDTPDDEQLSDVLVQVDDATAERGAVNVLITVTSVAGSAATVEVPISNISGE